MQEVVDNYTKANIPLDVMWGDIDYMERWRDFTFDPVNFPLPALQVCMHACMHEHARSMLFSFNPVRSLLPALHIHTQCFACYFCLSTFDPLSLL